MSKLIQDAIFDKKERIVLPGVLAAKLDRAINQLPRWQIYFLQFVEKNYPSPKQNVWIWRLENKRLYGEHQLPIIESIKPLKPITEPEIRALIAHGSLTADQIALLTAYLFNGGMR